MANTGTTQTVIAVKTAFGWAALHTGTGEYSDTCSTRREARAVAEMWNTVAR